MEVRSQPAPATRARSRWRWLLWLVMLAVVWMTVAHLTEVKQLLSALRRGQWQWVLVAAVLQGVCYLLHAALYHMAFRVVGVGSRLGELLQVWFASFAVNVAAQTGGSVLFVQDAARRGQPAARAAAGVLLALAADFGAFAGVLIVGLTVLFVRHRLRLYEISGAVVLFLMIGGWAGVLLLGLWRPERLRQLLEWLQRVAARVSGGLRRPRLLPEDWAERTARDFSEGAGAVTRDPRGVAVALGVALAAHLVSLASLYALFQAFHQPIDFGALVAGFAVGVLFWIVALTPEGAGVVEGVMVLAYTSLGVPAGKAIVVMLVFRGFTFWLPLAIGFVLLRPYRRADNVAGAGTHRAS